MERIAAHKRDLVSRLCRGRVFLCYNFPMDAIEIDALDPSEWEAYKNLRLLSLKEEPHAYLSTYANSSQEADDKWRLRLEDALKGDKQWLSFAKQNGKLIGMVGAFRIDDEPQAEIISAFVMKEFRGRGVGTKLMEHLLDTIQKNKEITKAHLEVNATQPAAVQLYKNCGFVITGSVKRVLGDGEEYDDYVMEKYL